MSHYTQYVVLHDDGHTQNYVGHPQKSFAKAEEEMLRLAFVEDYRLSELKIVEAPV